MPDPEIDPCKQDPCKSALVKFHEAELKLKKIIKQLEILQGNGGNDLAGAGVGVGAAGAGGTILGLEAVASAGAVAEGTTVAAGGTIAAIGTATGVGLIVVGVVVLGYFGWRWWQRQDRIASLCLDCRMALVDYNMARTDVRDTCPRSCWPDMPDLLCPCED